MQHAHRRSHVAHGALRRHTLPALLLTLGGGAFAGLATEAVAAPAVRTTPGSGTELSALGRSSRQAGGDGARASRSRTAEEDRPVPIPSPVVPPPPPAAPAVAQVVTAALPPPPAPKPKPAPSGSKPVPPAAMRIAGTCPVPAASFTDTFGAPRGGGRRHQGTDLMAPAGAPVYAVASGVVKTSSGGAGGISLYLRAVDGNTYYYAHNSSNVARSGQQVDAGELIARVGSSGNASASAPHVHFELQPGGARSINPYPFLRRICG